MRAGSLDQRITLERPVWETSPEGEARRQSWVVEAKDLPASVRHLRAQERLQSPKTLQTVVVSIWIRHRHVERTWRVLLDGQAYRITGLAPIGRREGVEISAESIEV